MNVEWIRDVGHWWDLMVDNRATPVAYKNYGAYKDYGDDFRIVGHEQLGIDASITDITEADLRTYLATLYRMRTV